MYTTTPGTYFATRPLDTIIVIHRVAQLCNGIEPGVYVCCALCMYLFVLELFLIASYLMRSAVEKKKVPAYSVKCMRVHERA